MRSAEYAAYGCSLSAHDLDGDLDLDLVTAGKRSSAPTVLLNYGDGSFAPRTYLVPGVITVADVTGEGRPDLVGAGAELSIAAKEGDGSFHASRVLTEAGAASQVLAADFDGDGAADLLTETGKFLAGLGDGTFEHREAGFEGSTNGATRLVPADLDEDGDLDLLTYHPSLASCCRSPVGFGILANDGAAWFENWGSLGEGAVTSLAVADIDGDGHLDVVAALRLVDEDPSSDLVIFPGSGDGPFADPVGRPFGFTADHLIAADLDLDGRADLAVASGSSVYSRSSIHIFLGRGGAEFEAGPSYDLASGIGFLGAADLDGDRLPEIIVGLPRTGRFVPSGEGALRILHNRGAGAFELAAEQYARTACVSFQTAAADLDGDGDLDLAVTRSYGDLALLWNRGDATFETAAAYVNSASWIAPADLDADGRLDLAAATSLGIALLRNDGIPPASLDRDQDGIPDECAPEAFHRGDPNSSGTTDLSDGITNFGFLFLGNPPTLSCKESADSNNDGSVDISDGIYLLTWLFTGGPAPAAPGSTDMPCGLDPDPPGSPGDLGCDTYTACK